MTRRATVLVMLAVALGAASASAKLPRDADEFRTRMSDKAGKPAEAAKLWFEALYVYTKEATRDAGRAMLGAIMLDTKWEKNAYFVERLRTRDYIFRSYAEGTSPDKGYKMNPDEFKLVLDGPGEQDKFRDNAWRLKLKTSGAKEPRLLVLLRGDDGLYRVSVYTDVYAEVEPPSKG